MFGLFKKNIKLIIGLGNPGEKYKNTRHNVGFLALDFLATSLCHPRRSGSANPRGPRWDEPGSYNCNIKFNFNKKFNADVSEIKLNNIKTILAKPQTFMNESGISVQKISSFYKIKPENVTILHDDLDLDFGKIKNTVGRGSAGHNGVGSIIKMLGTKDFNRVRIGIGRSDKIPADKYVLLPFNDEELDQLDKIFKKIKVTGI